MCCQKCLTISKTESGNYLSKTQQLSVGAETGRTILKTSWQSRGRAEGLPKDFIQMLLLVRKAHTGIPALLLKVVGYVPIHPRPRSLHKEDTFLRSYIVQEWPCSSLQDLSWKISAQSALPAL